jgi:uncharacterized protein (TIGR02118 family)
MHKLVILIEPLVDWSEFHERWPDFLRHAESMPGLIREATSQVEKSLFGERPVALMHELYFDSLTELRAALDSPDGEAAGRILHAITRDHLTLFITDCKEEDGDTLRLYRSGS